MGSLDSGWSGTHADVALGVGHTPPQRVRGIADNEGLDLAAGCCIVGLHRGNRVGPHWNVRPAKLPVSGHDGGAEGKSMQRRRGGPASCPARKTAERVRCCQAASGESE